MSTPALHLEAFHGHAIEQFVPSMSVLRAAPWGVASDGIWGRAGADGVAAQAAQAVRVERNRSPDQRGRHLVWADKFLWDTELDKKFGASDPAKPVPVSGEGLAVGMYTNTIASPALLALYKPALEKIAAAGHGRSGFNYVDFEPDLNATNAARGVQPWVWVWEKMRLFMLGASDEQLFLRVQESVYDFFAALLRVTGNDPRTLLMHGCADRPTTYAPGTSPVPAFPRLLPLNYICAATDDPAELDKLDRDLDGGSGPGTGVVTLSTLASPSLNARLLDRCARRCVPHVILFADRSYPDGSIPPEDRQRAAAAARLDAHLPVFRDFANS